MLGLLRRPLRGQAASRHGPKKTGYMNGGILVACYSKQRTFIIYFGIWDQCVCHKGADGFDIIRAVPKIRTERFVNGGQ